MTNTCWECQRCTHTHTHTHTKTQKKSDQTLHNNPMIFDCIQWYLTVCVRFIDIWWRGVGGAAASNIDVLKKNGITNVVNCTDNMPLYHEGTAGINVLFFAPKYVCKSKYAFLCGILDIINCADNMALYFVNKFCCMCVGNINLSIIDLILRAIGDLSKMGYVCIYVYIYTYVHICE